MIKSDWGKVLYKGNKPLLSAEFVSIVKGLLQEKIFTKNEINKLVKDGFKKDEQIKKEFNKKYKNGVSTNELQSMMTKLVEARKSGKLNEQELKTETIFENDKMKVTSISLECEDGENVDDKVNELLKKLFEKGEEDNGN